MVLTVSFAISPVIGLFVTVGDNARALHRISASRYQDHATSPSATCALVSCAVRVHRIFRPTFSDDRETSLLIGRKTREELPVICPPSQDERLRHFGTTGKSGAAGEIVSSDEQLLAPVSRARRSALRVVPLNRDPDSNN
jgi:hypothetical protein